MYQLWMLIEDFVIRAGLWGVGVLGLDASSVENAEGEADSGDGGAVQLLGGRWGGGLSQLLLLLSFLQ